MKHYLIKVHCCGPAWLIYAPALQLWTMANDRRKVVSHCAGDGFGRHPDPRG